jgi:type 1 fimbria pilin
MGICKNHCAINCTLSLQAGLYRYPFDAQLNQCGKAAACSAATYSVIGMQLARHASDNTSSREGNWAFYPRIYGTGVPEALE